MGNDTDCGLTEQAITLMDELYDVRYNVLDRTPEVLRRDQANKGFVPMSKLVRNTMVTASFNGAESDGVRRMWCSMRFAANAESIRTKGQKNKRYNVCVSRLARKT
ncbi:unknown [Prevotella sp. CAG:5226]|nr:unknown [Prevotella sp. CAG:5226]